MSEVLERDFGGIDASPWKIPDYLEIFLIQMLIILVNGCTSCRKYYGNYKSGSYHRCKFYIFENNSYADGGVLNAQSKRSLATKIFMMAQ